MQDKKRSIPELTLEQELQQEKIKMMLQQCMVDRDIVSMHKMANYLLQLFFLERRKSSYFAREAAANLRQSLGD
jgi:hypothetical protein